MTNIRFTETYKGYVYAALAAIFYGSSGLFVKLAQNTGLDSLNLLIVQHLVSVPILWIIAIIRYKNNVKIDKKNLVKLFFLGACLTSVINIFYYESFKYLDIFIATIILYTYPIVLALFSFIFLKQRLSRITLLSLFIAFLGCVLVLNLLNTSVTISTRGILYALCAAIGYAIFSMFLEGIDKNIPPLVFITYSTSFAFLGYLFIRPPIQLIKTGLTGTQIGIAATLAFICQIPPNTLLYMAVKAIGAVKTSVVANIEIPAAAILGYLFFRETLNLIQLLGMLLVVGGIVLMKNGELLLSKLRDK